MGAWVMTERVEQTLATAVFFLVMALLIVAILGLFVGIGFAIFDPPATYTVQRSEWTCTRTRDVMMGKTIDRQCVEMRRRVK